MPHIRNNKMNKDELLAVLNNSLRNIVRRYNSSINTNDKIEDKDKWLLTEKQPSGPKKRKLSTQDIIIAVYNLSFSNQRFPVVAFDEQSYVLKETGEESAVILRILDQVLRRLENRPHEIEPPLPKNKNEPKPRKIRESRPSSLEELSSFEEIFLASVIVAIKISSDFKIKNKDFQQLFEKMGIAITTNEISKMERKHLYNLGFSEMEKAIDFPLDEKELHDRLVKVMESMDYDDVRLLRKNMNGMKNPEFINKAAFKVIWDVISETLELEKAIPASQLSEDKKRRRHSIATDSRRFFYREQKKVNEQKEEGKAKDTNDLDNHKIHGR